MPTPTQPPTFTPVSTLKKIDKFFSFSSKCFENSQTFMDYKEYFGGSEHRVYFLKLCCCSQIPVWAVGWCRCLAGTRFRLGVYTRQIC
jgi:hypothetical protein